MRTPFCDLLGIDLPIILAGMAGGPTTPELVAAVSAAGGLGTFGIHMLTPEGAATQVKRARELTDRPIAVNVLLAPPTPARSDPEQVRAALRPVRESLGLADDTPPPASPSRPEELIEAALEAGANVISTGMGDPAPLIPIAQAHGVPVIAMVATVDEARQVAASGADVIVAQGGEAGGHRSNFAIPPDRPLPLVGTMALVRQVVKVVDVPVIAAGGIMDGAGLVAALALGAQGAQFGSRFLLARESGISQAYRDRLRSAKDTDSEIITAMSGRPARGLRNKLLDALEQAGSPSVGYPRQSGAWSDIRAAAQAAGSSDHVTLWAGQAAGLGSTDLGATEIVAEILDEATVTIRRLGQL